MQKLKSKLYDMQLKEENEKMRKMKKSQVSKKFGIRIKNYNLILRNIYFFFLDWAKNAVR